MTRQISRSMSSSIKAAVRHYLDSRRDLAGKAAASLDVRVVAWSRTAGRESDSQVDLTVTQQIGGIEGSAAHPGTSIDVGRMVAWQDEDGAWEAGELKWYV
jgi:hypothetical protein